MGDISQPRIGIFWWLPTTNEIVEFTQVLQQIQIVGGFRTSDYDHVTAWRIYISSRKELSSYDYEYHPRGRVNWSQADGFILLADKVILTKGKHKEIISKWGLPSETIVLTDLHYRHHPLTSIFTGNPRG